jgi:hypothetical protein
MKKYKYFLLENKINSSTVKEVLTEEEFNDLLSTNCKDFSWDDIPIYKGFNDNTIDDSNIYLYFNPTMETRKSKNTFNYYTLLFDNSPYIGDFPKRSKSLICTSSCKTAWCYTDHGNPYRVIPFDNAKIAICPADDFWSSFESINKLRKFRSMPGMDLSDFNRELRDSYHEIFDEYLCENDFDILKSQLNKLLEYLNSKDESQLSTQPLTDVKTIDDIFQLLNPYKNNHTLIDYNEYKKQNGFNIFVNKEIWIDSKCLLVEDFT